MEYRPYTRRKKLSAKERRRRENSQRQGSLVEKEKAREQFDSLFPTTVRVTCPHGVIVEELDYWTTSAVTNLPDHFAWNCTRCNSVCPHNIGLTPDEINSGKQFSLSCSNCKAGRPASWANMIEGLKDPFAGGKYPTTIERDENGVFKKRSGKFHKTGGLLGGVAERGTRTPAKKTSVAGKDGDAGFDESMGAAQCAEAGTSTSGHHGTFSTIKIGDISASAEAQFNAEQGVSDLPQNPFPKPLQHGARADGAWKADKQVVLTKNEKQIAREINMEANRFAIDADVVERADQNAAQEKADVMREENLTEEEYKELEEPICT
jgi:hypothetical protein